MEFDVVSYLFVPVSAFVFLYAVFTPIEQFFPAREQKFFRREWGTDFCFFLGQHLLWVGLIFALLAYFSQWVDDVMPFTFRDAVAKQPWFLQVIEVIILSDFLIYWGHRLQHRNDFLWRFHSVHHTSKDLDWIASFREHPLDALYTIGLINLPAIILGFPLHSIAAFIAFRGIWAIYIHSNITLPLGPFRLLLGSPEIHHWHHAMGRDVGNYANLSPLMDVIFGTHYCPAHFPDELGVKGREGESYLDHMINPFKSVKSSDHNSDTIKGEDHPHHDRDHHV